MSGKLHLLLAAVFVISVVSTTDAAGVKRRDVASTAEPVEKESEPSLEERINELKIKVANLVKDGKQNEKAFLDMTDQVKKMDDKVKQMIDRLKKINSADYLNGGLKDLD